MVIKMKFARKAKYRHMKKAQMWKGAEWSISFKIRIPRVKIMKN